jgi:uroporphyrinogen decarboxylase
LPFGQGDGRTHVYSEVAKQLVVAGQQNNIPVLGDVIGPFSLAGHTFGVSETLELSASEPQVVEALLKKVTPFLIEYVLAFRQIGVAGVIMAEPVAGLL